MKKIILVLGFCLLSFRVFSLEFSPFLRDIISASPQRLIGILENTGRTAFNDELIRLVNGFSQPSVYYYDYDRLDPQSRLELADCSLRVSIYGDDVRWMWDKVWHVMVIGSGIVFDQSAAAYEAHVQGLYDLAGHAEDLRKSRYENDLTGFARLVVQPPSGQKFRLPQIAAAAAPAPVPQLVYVPAEPDPPAREAIVPTAAASGPAKFIPRAPDPASGKVYRIQVGSFLGINSAQDAIARLRGAGFSPAFEVNGDYYRLVIPNIPAAEMGGAAKMLGTAGFTEAWVREE
jgi:hypothetical protein